MEEHAAEMIVQRLDRLIEIMESAPLSGPPAAASQEQAPPTQAGGLDNHALESIRNAVDEINANVAALANRGGASLGGL